MKYQDFIENVKECIEKKISDRDAEISVRSVVKSNDRVLDSLTITEEGQTADPMVYLNDFYTWFQNGGTIEEIADRIIEIHDHQYHYVLPLQYIDLESFEIAKAHLTCKLFNTAINEKYLADAVRISFFDLSVVFYFTMIVEGEHVFSSKVTEDLLDKWGLTVQELFEYARINTGQMLGIYLKEIEEVFLEAGLWENEDDEVLKDALKDEERSQIYILSNNTRTYGAVNMLDYEVLHGLAEKTEDDLYIIPSSVHEVLLIPVHDRLSKEEVDQMIMDVNRSVLDPSDILSDHVYIYSREENRIVV